MRLEFSRKTRAQGFARAQGACEICGCRLWVGHFAYHHIKEANDGGEATLANLLVLCDACHAPLTATYIVQTRKAERIRDRHNNAMPKSSRPMPGSRASFWKCTFSNGWVRR